MGIIARQQPGAEIGLPDPAAGIDPWPEQKAQVIGTGDLLEAGNVGQGGKPDVAPFGHHLETLANQRPIDARKRHDIAHRAQCHEVQPLAQIGLGAARPGVPAGLAQPSVDTDRQQECHAHRRHLLVRAVVIDPVGIDHRNGLWQRDLGHVVVDDDGVEPCPLGLGQWLESGHTAIDGDDDCSPIGLQLQQRGRVRPITFLAAVRNIDVDIAAYGAEKSQQQRRGGRAVDVIVAEHDNPLALLHGLRHPRDRCVHVLEMRRIRQEAAERRVEKIRHRVRIDIACRQKPCHCLRQPMTLGDGERRTLVGQPRSPASPGQRPFNAEKRCALAAFHAALRPSSAGRS